MHGSVHGSVLDWWGGWEWEEPRRPWFDDDEVIYRPPLYENVLDFLILMLNHLTIV